MVEEHKNRDLVKETELKNLSLEYENKKNLLELRIQTLEEELNDALTGATSIVIQNCRSLVSSKIQRDLPSHSPMRRSLIYLLGRGLTDEEVESTLNVDLRTLHRAREEGFSAFGNSRYERRNSRLHTRTFIGNVPCNYGAPAPRCQWSLLEITDHHRSRTVRKVLRGDDSERRYSTVTRSCPKAYPRFTIPRRPEC